VLAALMVFNPRLEFAFCLADCRVLALVPWRLLTSCTRICARPMPYLALNHPLRDIKNSKLPSVQSGTTHYYLPTLGRATTVGRLRNSALVERSAPSKGTQQISRRRSQGYATRRLRHAMNGARILVVFSFRCS